MKTFIPHLWYDKEAREATLYYCGLFPDSGILDSLLLKDTPSGDAERIRFRLAGQEFNAISGGPFFRFTPAISFRVACGSEEEREALREMLSPDPYGLSWSLDLKEGEPAGQKITPVLLFSGQAAGMAEEAARYYTGLFEGSGPLRDAGLGTGAGEAAFRFRVGGLDFLSADDVLGRDFRFNEAVSFIVPCKDGEELDFLWSRLSAVPEAESCGWLKDRYGVSWQIVPEGLEELLESCTPEERERVMKVLLRMTKIDLDALLLAKE